MCFCTPDSLIIFYDLLNENLIKNVMSQPENHKPNSKAEGGIFIVYALG